MPEWPLELKFLAKKKLFQKLPIKYQEPIKFRTSQF